MRIEYKVSSVSELEEAVKIVESLEKHIREKISSVNTMNGTTSIYLSCHDPYLRVQKDPIIMRVCSNGLEIAYSGYQLSIVLSKECGITFEK